MIAGLLHDIAGLSSLVLSTAILLALVLAGTLFREQTRTLLGRLAKFRFKRGDTEFSVNDEPLLPTAQIVAASNQESAPPPSEKGKDESAVPQQPANSDWETEMFFRAGRGDLEGAKEAYDKLQEKEQDPAKRIDNQTWYLWARYRKGDADAQRQLRNLEEIAKAHPAILSTVIRLDAGCYAFAEQHETAARRYKDAANVASNDVERALNLTSAAASLTAAKQNAAARQLLRDSLSQVTDPGAQGDIYIGLAATYAADKDEEGRAIMIEKALLTRPNSAAFHFDAAYAYANAGLEALAISHYRKTIQIDSKHKSALNNLGVAFWSADAKKLAIDYYKRAIEAGETLAASNLANVLMDVGAVESARDLLIEAQKSENPHPNVNQSFVRLDEVEKANTERRAKIEELAIAFRMFLLAYGDAILAPDSLSTVDGEWQSSDAVEVSAAPIDGQRLKLTWKVDSQRYRFVGRIVGLGASGEISKFKRDFWPLSTTPGEKEKGTWEKYARGRAYLTPKGDVLRLFGVIDENNEFLQREFMKTAASLPVSSSAQN